RSFRRVRRQLADVFAAVCDFAYPMYSPSPAQGNKARSPRHLEKTRTPQPFLRNAGRSCEQVFQRGHENIHADGLADEWGGGIGPRDPLVTAVTDVGDTALFQSRAPSGAVAVRKSRVNYRPRQNVV